MPSLWVDQLCLHGHISDVKLLRKLASLPSSRPEPRPAPTKTCTTLAKKAVKSLRLCLGIGDGLLRSQ